MKSFFRLTFWEAKSFSITKDRYLHCKTVPFYILATTCEGHYELESDNAPPIVCEEGGGFFTPPNTPLKIRHYVNRSTKRMTVRFVHFLLTDSAGQDPFSARTIPPAVFPSFLKKNGSDMDRLIAGTEPDIVLNAVAMSLIAELYALTGPKPFSPPEHEYVRKICRLVDGRPERAFRTADLLNLAHTSKSKFFADFKEETGMTPADYVRKSRIEFAMRLLLSERGMPIKEVSECGGWKNMFHFSREFKKHTGISPKTYRSRHQYPEDF